MIQNFKRYYYLFVTDPALILMLPFWPLYVLGLVMQHPVLWCPAILIIFALAFWQKFCRIDIGRNFQALPALPRGYRTIGQRAQKGAGKQSCKELRRSLLQDSWDAATRIPAGKYQTITHGAVLKRLERKKRITVESVIPLYTGTLQPILKAQTRNRCRHCKAPCNAWSAPARQFYLVRFLAHQEIQEGGSYMCNIRKNVSMILAVSILMSTFITIPVSASTTTTNVTYNTEVESHMTQTSHYKTCISLIIADSYEFYGGEYHLINPGMWNYNPNYPSGSYAKILRPGMYAILNGSVNTEYLSNDEYEQMLKKSSNRMIQIKQPQDPSSYAFTCNSYSVPGNNYNSYKFTFPCDLYVATTRCDIFYSYSGVIPLGAPSIGKETGIAGQTATVKANPAFAGYTFSGWSTSDVNVSGAGAEFTIPTNDVRFTGSWIPRTDIPYTVEFYKQNVTDDGYTLQTSETIKGKGTTDTEIRAVLDVDALSIKYPHYHLTEESKNDKTVIGGNGTSILKLYYDFDTANVSYSFDGTIPKKDPLPPKTKAQRYGSTVTVEQVPTLPGYDFSGWASEDADITSGSFTMDDKDVNITGTWIPHTDTPYVVEYYLQNLDDDGYLLADTENCTGTTDTMATVPEKTYTGFSMTPASLSSSTSTNIDGDGGTVAKIYFDRNVNSVTYAYSGDTDVTPPVLPEETTCRYGQTVTLDTSAPALQGYDFGGWEVSGAEVSEGRFIMPDGPVVITGKWVPRTDTPFTVEYYQQNLVDNQYKLAYTFNGKGTTGKNVPHKEFVGFTEVPDSVTAEGNAKISSDGSTALKLYYDRNVNTVTYAYSGETDVTPPTLPVEKSYHYGQMVTLDTSTPALQGYDFGGWEVSGAEVSKGQLSMPDCPVVITGTWIPRTDTPFAVEYYQQNVKDDDYTLVSTLNGTGTTGANIPHKEFEGFVETPDSVNAEGSMKIRSDGSTALKLYYDRSSYQVTFLYSGATPEDAPPLPAKNSYRYGTEVNVPEIPGALSGMSFSGWFTEDKRLSEKTFTVPAQDTQIIGGWSEIHYSDSDKPELPSTKPVPVQTLEDNGSAYIIGYDDGTFRPDDFLTAKQEEIMLSRLGLSVTPLSVVPEDVEDTKYITRREFLSALLDASEAPVPDVSNPMSQAAAQGWITGYANGELYPEAYITRAQAVTIINRAFGRTAMQDDAYEISYADLPRNHWAYDAVIAASTTM